MNYLLDTNIFLWSINDDKKLPNKIRSILNEDEHNYYISIASLWEIIIKISLDKLSLDIPLSEIIQKLRETDSIRILQIKPEHIYQLENLPFCHKDPFDRIIFIQSRFEDMRFLFTDEIFKKYESYYTD